MMRTRCSTSFGQFESDSKSDEVVETFFHFLNFISKSALTHSSTFVTVPPETSDNTLLLSRWSLFSRHLLPSH